MGWFIPENKLDPQQNGFLERKNIDTGNYWIKGFPGSGKSVLLAYSLKKIRAKNPNASIAVVVFTHSLIAMYKAALVEGGQYADIMTYHEYYFRMRFRKKYDFILCDEVQDFVAEILAVMRTSGAHIIAAGDENQSIFDYIPKFEGKTVEPSQISGLLEASPYELGIIHRLSRSIISAVQKMMPFMNIFSAKRDMTKIDTQIRLCQASDIKEEVSYVMDVAEKALNRGGKTVAILVPTQNAAVQFVQNVLDYKQKDAWNVVINKYNRIDFGSLNSHLESNGIKMQYIGSTYGEFSEDNRKIAVMTYHSSKGLDFDTVFMPGVNRAMYIGPNETLNKAAFMVAMTRCRGELYFSYCGETHKYLENFSQNCNYINIHDSLNAISSNAGGNIFGF